MNLFPSTWRLDEAKKVCEEIVDCINKTAPIVDYETPYRMIRTTNVKDGRINLDGARHVDEATFIKWNRRLTPKKNDIVLTREAPLGDVGLIRTEDKVFLGQRTMLYRANPRILDQRFLYYTLLGPTLQAQLKTLGSGSTVEHVRVPDAEKLIIPYPTLEEQGKIAAILSAYDDLIENNKRRIILLEKMAEEIYREWFVRFRFPGHQTAKFEKGIPEGWSRKKLEGLCSLVKRGISPKYSESSDRLVINQKCIRKGRIDLDEARTHDSNVPEEKYIQYCDSLINSTGAGTLGRVSVVEFEPHDITVDSHVTICRASPDVVDPLYLASTVRKLEQYFEFMATGSTGQVELNKSLIERVEILVPDSLTQQKFRDIIEPIFKQKRHLFSKIQVLVKAKNLLLPRLISGKLSVEELDIAFPPSMQEPAG